MATIMTPEQWWPSPAKLNLFLHINGQNTQGYHLLQSLFQILDYGDELAYEVLPNKTLEMVSGLDEVPDEENLILRAAKLLQRVTGIDLGCRISVKKILPMGGGIGGGSSNAATTLVALNHLWKTGLSTQKLAELGLQLGADVPIFVHGKTAFAQGVGEVITPTEVATQYYLVVFPNCHVSTAQVFSAANLPRNTPKIQWTDYDFDKTHNDCQKLVCDSYPNVAKILRHLLEYAPSRMTGTGACIFAVFDSLDNAQQVKTTLPDDCQAFIAKGVNTSPLLTYLEGLKPNK